MPQKINNIVTDEELLKAVRASNSYAAVIRYLGKKQAGGTQAHYIRRIKRCGFDVSHFFYPANKGKISPKRKNASDILVKQERHKRAKPEQLRRALIESGIEYKCKLCLQDGSWRGNPLTLDVDHINKDWTDNRIENLRFLCPNCHSQFSRNLL